MSNESLKLMQDFHEKLRKDPERLKVFLRSVMGRPHKTLQGKERDDVLLLLAMMEPFNATNNQHSFTEYYMIGDTEYHATYFPEDKNGPVIDKMLPEDEE